MAVEKNQYQNDTTGSGPSPALWHDCPITQMLAYPSVGYLYWEDYLGPLDPTTATGYTITQEASGLIEGLDGIGGILNVSSNGHNAAHDGINVQMLDSTGGENWLPAAGKTLWFEARWKVNDESDEYYVGLCDRETDIIEQTSGMLDSTARNMIGFYTDAGTTATYLECVSAKAGTAQADSDINGAVIADDTYLQTGFKVYSDEGQLKIDYYIDGALIVGSRVTDTDDIPITTGTGEMALSYVAQVAATGANAELYVDWVRIAQLR
jgi:hypothetical protein